MKTKHFTLALGAGAALWVLANPAAGQDSPESLLPEGFEDPVPPPPPAAPAPNAPPSPVPAGPLPQPSTGLTSSEEGDGDELGGEGDEDALAELGLEDLPPEYELPAAARRQLDHVGPLTPERGGYGRNAFAGFNGRYLASLMRRLDAPVPSRWLHIALRRALLSDVATPASVPAPNWVAERAWLLLRMGEVDGARMLVQRVDSNRYSPRLYEIAMQVALASGEPSALCPFAGGARRMAETPAWIMAEAICAGLAGESVRATSQMTAARRRGITNGFDILLGEKAANAGTSSAGVAVNWEGVERLNAWRFGMATATGEEIPDALFASAGPQVAAWRARSPHIALADRVGPARIAAALGVLSNQALVSMYSALLPEIDPADLGGSPTDRLRAAYVRTDIDERMEALRALWEGNPRTRDRYAGLVLAARAAALIPRSENLEADSGDLIAAMLSAGFDLNAVRWAPVVEAADEDDVDQAWALLAVGAPRQVVTTDLDRVEDYARRAGSDGRYRAELLAAALAGLGRLPAGQVDQSFELGLDRANGWTRQLDRAARARHGGSIALLAAIGMQAPNWRSIPPSHLYHVVRAFRLAGREPEARMIAAEAVTRA